MRAAVEAGTLPGERLESFQKLTRDTERRAARHDSRAQATVKSREKAITNAAYARTRSKRK